MSGKTPETEGLIQTLSHKDTGKSQYPKSKKEATEVKPKLTPYQSEMIGKFGTLIAAAAKSADYLQNGQVVALKYEVEVIDKDGNRKKETREFTLTKEAPQALQDGVVSMYADVMRPNAVLKDAADQLLTQHRETSTTSTEVFNRMWETPTE